FSFTVRAHKVDVHARLVGEAIDYINAQGSPMQKEALLRMSEAVGGEPRLRDILAGAAKSTDFYEDTVFYTNSWLSEIYFGKSNATEYEGNYFTRLNHFMNSGKWYESSNSSEVNSVLWRNQNGYYYQWSSKQGDDQRAMSSD